MEIAVLGATGRTGRHVVRAGAERGYAMRAITRRPPETGAAPEELPTATRWIGADAFDAAALDAAVAGTDCVISTLGIGATRAETELYSRGIANVLTAMRRHGVTRLIVLSAAPAGPRAEQPALERFVLMPLLERFFGATYADMRRMEAALAASEAEWVALRPPRLVDRPATGAYRIGSRPLPRGRRITCADLATAALDLVERAQPSRQGLYVAN